jgi:glucokinase
LLLRCDHQLDQLSAKIVAQAASEGNELAKDVLVRAVTALGWAIAQAITLTAVEVVVVGGGVSLIGDQLFFSPLYEAVDRYVFPPLRDTYEILPAGLGEQVVLHGAMCLAEDAKDTATNG